MRRCKSRPRSQPSAPVHFSFMLPWLWEVEQGQLLVIAGHSSMMWSLTRADLFGCATDSLIRQIVGPTLAATAVKKDVPTFRLLYLKAIDDWPQTCHQASGEIVC
jgi:hypothetical protein